MQNFSVWGTRGGNCSFHTLEPKSLCSTQAAVAMSKNSLFTSHTALSDEVMDYFRKLDQKDKIMVEYMYAH
jgi:hypothetical protein